MKNNILQFSIILALLSASNLQAQNMFQKVLGGTGDDFSYFSELTPDSGQITFGSTDGFGFGSEDFYLVKTDVNGDTLWAKAYGNIGSEIGRHMQQTSDGGYILIGETESFGAGVMDIYVVKTNSTGDTLWTRAFGGTGIDYAYYVVETSDSGYVICGGTESYGAGSADAYLLRLDSSGDTLWTRTYGGAGDEWANSVRETMDGGFVITGEAYSFGAGNADVYLIRTDAMGDTLWTKVYGGAGFDGGWAVLETPDSGFVISGWTNSAGAGGFDVYLIRTDSIGDTLWTKSYGGGADDIGLGIALTPDSGYMVTGYTYSFGISGDVYALALTSSGDTIWTRAYGGVLADAGYSINTTPDNGYMISGYSYSFSSGDSRAYLIKTDSMGNSGSCYETVTATSVTDIPGAVSSTATVVGNGVIVNTTTTVVSTSATISRAEYSVALAASSDLSCNADSSGSATVLVTGGTFVYTYTWNDANSQTTATANTLYADTFQLVVTDGFGCMDSVSVTLTEPAAFLPVTTNTDIQCNGDSNGVVSVSISGGVGPLTYMWDDPANQTTASATGLNGGTYMVIITDSTGCMDSASATVTEPGPLLLGIADTVYVSCNADSSASAAAVITGGTAPFTYQWDDLMSQTDSVAVNLASGSYTLSLTDSNGCTASAGISIGFSASITSSSPYVCGGICDGSATATATGGTAPITYAWNDPSNQNTATATALCGGYTFAVTITESGGCTSIDSVTLIGIPVLNDSVTPKDIICFGDSNGEATAVVSGGNPPYTYFWPATGETSVKITNLGPGTYFVILTDNSGCSKTISGTVIEPAALGVSYVVTPTTCKGSGDGEINLTVTGGTPFISTLVSPYIYTWNNPNTSSTEDVTDLFAGFYTVNISDTNNCTILNIINVTEPSSIALSGSFVADTGNSSGSAWVVAGGGTPPYSYVWSFTGSTIDTIYSLSMGTYSVTVTDANDCIGTLTIHVSDGENPLFQATFEGAMDDFARSVDEVTGGGFVMTGFTSSFGEGGKDVYLVRTDGSGNYMWSKTYGGAADDEGNSVIQTSDGGFIIAGYTKSFGAGGSDVYLIKTNSSGNITWTMAYGGSSDDRGFSVRELLGGGGYVIAGGTNSFGAGETDIYVIVVDVNGAVQWTATYGSSGFDYGYSVEQTSDNGYIIAGYTYGFGVGNADAYLIKTDNLGNQTWTRVFGGDDNEELRSVKQTSDGGYIVAGFSKSFGTGEEDVFVVKLDNSGTPEWSKTYGGDNIDVANSVAESFGGGYIIAGTSNSFSNADEEVYLIKVDANGDEEWAKTYGGTFNDRGWGVIQTADQGYAIAGSTTSFTEFVGEGNWKFYLIKTDGLGNSSCNQNVVESAVKDTTVMVNIGGSDVIIAVAGVSTATVAATNNTIAGSLCFITSDIGETAITKEGNLIVYPNPNNGTFSVSIIVNQNDKNASLRVFDIKGQLIYRETDLGTGKLVKQIELGNVDKGMYFVQLISRDGVITKKIICQ